MSIWKDIPYELQSPSHRNAYNYANNAEYAGWDAGLSDGMATTFLDHQARVEKIRASERNSVNVDGSAGFVNMISSFAGAALDRLGAVSEPTHATVQPASFGRGSSAGMDSQTMMIVGLVGVGIYLAMKA